MNGGPWMVGGRKYHEWRKVPRWFRRRVRRFDKLPTLGERHSGWSWLAGSIGFALLVAAIAEVLWKL
jgi:hypothetical protein